jgi:hypothetical protein
VQHLIAIDDAPFDKFRDPDALVVGVVTAGRGRVEGVLTTRVPIDAPDATERLARWVTGSRFHPSLRSLLLEGITIAGLAVIDLPRLHEETGLPVISVQRRRPEPGRLEEALERLGFHDRLALVAAAGPFHPLGDLLVFNAAGVDAAGARRILEETTARAHIPEGLRLAHLIGQGLVIGESKGS